MTGHPCACGYQAASDDDLADHLSHALIPDDDKAADGQLHAEAADQPNHSCLCGYLAVDSTALDAHLLHAFGSSPATTIHRVATRE